MGHFGRGPIRIAWTALVLPSLARAYLSQGAAVLAHPETATNPFFLMVPAWALLPLVLLATVATVIASQAVITGAFSVAHQAMQLGHLPRLTAFHTSETEIGQIYLPRVNWILLLGVLTLVLAFETSSNLASAYGIAVTGDMIITSLLAAVVFRLHWRWPLAVPALVFLPMLGVEIMFLAANLTKVFDGGYVTIAVAVLLGVVMWTWVRGVDLVRDKVRRKGLPLAALIASLAKPAHVVQVPGTAVFLTADAEMAPSALLHNLKHNAVLHEQNVVVSIRIATRPRVSDEERIRIERLSDDFTRLHLTFGFLEQPNVPRALSLARRSGLHFDIMTTSFFLHRRYTARRRPRRCRVGRRECFCGSPAVRRGRDHTTSCPRIVSSNSVSRPRSDVGRLAVAQTVPHRHASHQAMRRVKARWPSSRRRAIQPVRYLPSQ